MKFEYDGLKFDWDEEKYNINAEKHGIYFEEAASIFADENAVILPDPEHSYYEERFRVIGCSDISKMLTVCHCERNENDIIRIISAWKATNKEKQIYRTGGIL